MKSQVNKLYKKASQLPIQERRMMLSWLKQSIDMYRKQWTVDQRYGILLPIVEKIWKQKISPERTSVNSTMRSFIAYKMRMEGYRLMEIGRAIEKHHATVMAYIRKMNDMFDIPKMYYPELKKYAEFEDAVKEYDKEHPVTEEDQELDDSPNQLSLGQA